MHTRLLFCTVRPHKLEEARRIFADTAERLRAQYPGCRLLQVMESGNDVVAFTSWDTPAELEAYATSDLARQHFAALAPLLMGVPSVKSYAVKLHAGR